MLESLDVQSAVGITENEKTVTSFTAEAKGGYLWIYGKAGIMTYAKNIFWII